MIKLLCFPYAGGTASIYKRWRISPGNVLVLPVELPGRGFRHRETPLADISELADFIVSEYGSNFLSPFALFGHSFGALLAFAVAELLATQCIYPVHLFVSASRAPHECPQSLLHCLCRSALLNELVRLKGISTETLSDEDLIDFILPRIRLDLRAAEEYCVKVASLPFPITAFGGTEDLIVKQSQLEGWRMCTSEKFSLRMLSGHHFFLQTRCEDLLTLISETLIAPTPSEP
jgi:surfactin synthase thioesterase subunit